MYDVSIQENCGVGTTVAWIQALDDDSGNFGTRGIRYTNLGGGISHLCVFFFNKLLKKIRIVIQNQNLV